ncbi:MAG: VOC family protein [Solirubrobacteraceae bacterium]
MVLRHVHPQDREAEAELPTRETGLFLYIKVDDVEGFHKAVLSKGMKPDSEPQGRPSGIREFVLRDADGYKLAFLQK